MNIRHLNLAILDGCSPARQNRQKNEKRTAQPSRLRSFRYRLKRLGASTFSSWYDAKHPKPSPWELSFVNSVKVDACPYCVSEDFVKDGFRRSNGTRIYRCRKCGRHFNPLTGTLFDNHKIPISEWFKFVIHLSEYHSVSTSANDNRNARNTGYYWTKKIFSALEDSQSGVKLSGIVYIDETYVTPYPSERKVPANGKGRFKAGLSKDLYCKATALEVKFVTDENGDEQRISLKGAAFCCGNGQPSYERLKEIYPRIIAPGSTVIHDDLPPYDRLVESMGCKGISYPSNSTKRLPDDEDPMQPINDFHGSIQSFLRAHRSFERRNLQDWLNLFCFFWNTPGTNERKAVVLTEKVVSKRQIIRYQ